jgi:hypothetical protein
MINSIPVVSIAVRSVITNTWGKALVFGIVEWLVYTTLNAIVLLGALRMKKFRSYRLARFACILSCVPCVIAMWPVGAFGGALGLVFLGRADVKQRFLANDNKTPKETTATM